MFATQSVELPRPTYSALWEYLKQQGRQWEIPSILAVSPNQLAQHFGRSTRNAWNDLFIRRPGDKAFKQACVLRIEVEREEQALRQARLTTAGPAVAPPGAPCVLSATPVRSSSADKPGNALPTMSDSDLSPQALAAIVTSVLAHIAPSRDTTPGPGWNLPERRKHRYRLEDVAFE